MRVHAAKIDRVVFVAGDGSSGRIMCEAMDELQKRGFPLALELIVQKGGGAEQMCIAEEQLHIAIPADHLNGFFVDGPYADELSALIKDAALVVVGHSATAFHVEYTANVMAFEQRTSVIRVLDHPLGTYDPFLLGIETAWNHSGQPPFRITVTTRPFGRALAERYHAFATQIALIGNPLHAQIERLHADGQDVARTRLAMKHSLSLEAPVLSAFLFGEGAQLRESLAMVDGFADVISLFGGSILCDVHATIPQESRPEISEHIATWRQSGVTVLTQVPQDEMIVLATLVLTDASSTTVERALTHRIPVAIQCGPVALQASYFQDEQKRDFAVGGLLGAVLEATDPQEAASLLGEAMNSFHHDARYAAARASGILPQLNAMERLIDLIIQSTM